MKVSVVCCWRSVGSVELDEGRKLRFPQLPALQIDEGTRPIDFSSAAERRLLESAAIAELSRGKVSVANL